MRRAKKGAGAEAEGGLKLKSWRRSRLRSLEALLEPSFEASKNFNFEYKEHSKRNHTNHIPRSQRLLESSLRASKTLTNHKSMKLYKFKPLKPRKTSTTNLQRRRTHEEHEEREEQRISKQAHSQRFIVILFQRSLIHSSAKLKYIRCSNQNHITTNPINKSFKEIE